MESEIKTRVTPFSEPCISAEGGQDCLVVIYAPSSEQLGKRFSLREGVVHIGRGSDTSDGPVEIPLLDNSAALLSTRGLLHCALGTEQDAADM